MSDATSFASFAISAANQFNSACVLLKQVSDRIAADSSLSSNAATAANNRLQRSDLAAADFDNLKVVADLILTTLNANNNDTVPVSINTGGMVKLGFYKMV